MKRASILTFLGVVLILISSFHLYYQKKDVLSFSRDNPPSSRKDEKTHATVAATGDIMMHSPQIRSGLQKDNTYNFSSFFKEVKPYFSSCDLAIANFETTLYGKPPYTGYPRFNAPDEIVDGMRDAGINLVTTANNHALDTGAFGVKRTNSVLTEKGLTAIGTARTPEQRKPTLIKKNGICFGFLSYTESTNGLPIPQSYLVNTIDLNKISKDIKQAKKDGAEFIFVSLHFGNEYQRTPNDYQVNISNKVLKSGADVILGSHPHVIQPMKKVKMDGKDKFIIYSMGNFISNQSDPHTDEGIILYFDIEKEKNVTRLKNVSYLPTLCHRYWINRKLKYVVIPIEEQFPNHFPQYPGITKHKWANTYIQTHRQVASEQSFPVFQLNK